MKQGTIDGMELPSFTFISDKFQEVTKYYSLTRHSYPPIAWFMNLKRSTRPFPHVQKVLDDSMKDACHLHRRLEVEKEKSDFEVMKKALMKPAYDYVESQVGKEFMIRLRSAIQAASK